MSTKTLSPEKPRPGGRGRLVLAGAVLAVLFVWWLWPRGDGDGSATAYHEVRRSTFTVSIVEGGTLAAVSEVSVRNEVEGTARVIYIVPEGTFVKKGDLVVELDSAQAQDQVNQQQINFEKAQFALVQAQEQLGIQRSSVESDIRAAELKVYFAELDLKKYEQGQRVVDLVEATNKLVQAEAQLKVNEQNYSWTTNLAARGYETKQKEDVDRLTVLNNRNSLIVASNSIWMLDQFDIPKQRELFLSNLREAKKDLERVQAQSRAKIAQAEADLQTQSNTLALNSKKLERDRKNLAATKVYAPQDGLVVYAAGENRFSSESLIEEGAVVRNRQELIKLPDTSRMKVTVKVHESHISMIREGLPAFVTLDSIPDEHFSGAVERVALLPDTQARWGNPNLKVYNTEVHITQPLPDNIKPGVSAKAEIIITNIENALSVPIQAVTTLKGRQVVYLANGRNPSPKPVEVGLYNTKFIQVISGLNEGDRVLLAPPLDLHEKDLEGAVLPDDEKAKVKVTNAPPASPRPGGQRGSDFTSAGPSGTNGTAATGMRSEGAQPRNRERSAGAGAGAGAGRGGEGTARIPDAGRGGGAPDQEGAPGQPGQGQGQAGQGRPRFDREAMMKRFDTDGDGTLSESERAAMTEALGAARGGNRGNRQGGGGAAGGPGSEGPGGGGRRPERGETPTPPRGE